MTISDRAGTLIDRLMTGYADPEIDRLTYEAAKEIARLDAIIAVGGGEDKGVSQDPQDHPSGSRDGLEAPATAALAKAFWGVTLIPSQPDLAVGGTAALANWQPIETAPKDGTEVLIWNIEGHELATWHDREEDGVDQPGHDAGWVGTYAFPGRSWGHSMRHEPQGQPSRWMPLPEPPSDLLDEEEFTPTPPASTTPETGTGEER